MLRTVATWSHRNNTTTCHWVGSEQTTKHNDDSFHGRNYHVYHVYVRIVFNYLIFAVLDLFEETSLFYHISHCFQLFDICRVGFIWGNITFLSYIDGLVQQRRNSGAFSNGEHYVFLALTHRNTHHGTRSRVYHTLTTVDDLVPQGANASADILNTTFLWFFLSSVLAVLQCSWLLMIFCTCSVFSKTWRKIWQRKNKNCTTTSTWFQIIKPGNWNKYIQTVKVEYFPNLVLFHDAKLL